MPFDTGVTFNLNKTVTDEEQPSTPDKPSDGAKLDTKTAGEKKGKNQLIEFIKTSKVLQTVSTAVNSTIQNIEGSQMAEQASALKTAASDITGLVMMASNPYALIATLACKGVSYGFQQAKFSREKAWQDYDLEEYRSARGYFAAINRSRG